MRCLLLLAATCAALFYATEAKKGYLLTAPKVLDAGSTERLCLTLTDVKDDGQITVRLLQEKVDSVITQTVIQYKNGGSSCFHIDIPNVKYASGRLQVKGEFGGNEKYSFQSESKVALATRSTVTFVQTDKAVYKPGQKVQFRILTLNHVLRPVNGNISKVYIQNPDGVRVEQWLNVVNDNGLVQLDMQLSDEPTLGMWKIFVLFNGVKTEQKFEINEYVLPKFEVKITPPAYLLANAESATWKVCAMYTYGKGVKGNMTVMLKYNTYRWDYNLDKYPVHSVETEIDGCHDVTVSAATMKWDTNLVRYKNLEVSAEVEEYGTGIKFQDKKTISIGHNPLDINFKSDDSTNFFKPGLPYKGRLLVTRPNKSPAEDELIKICYTAVKKRYESGKSVCKNFTTDEAGLVDFTVPPQKPEIVDISVEATAVLYDFQYYDPTKKYQEKIRRPVSSTNLKAWYSDSGSFLDITRVYDPVGCNEKIMLDVHYTTNDEDVAVNYQVMSRGRIVANGEHSHAFGKDDYKTDDSYIVDEKQKSRVKRYREYEEPVNYTLPKSIGKFMVMFDVTPEMSPIARVLLFYIRADGEVVATHTKVDVKPCFENKVNLKFTENSIYPGTEAEYKISASANSLCALGAVDKSVHLLRSDNQLTSDKVFEVMKKFDAGRQTKPTQLNDYEYCKKRLKGKIPTEPPITRRPPGPRLPGPPGPPAPVAQEKPIELVARKKRSSPPWSHESYKSNYADALMSFEECGQVPFSNLIIESRPCVYKRKNQRPFLFDGGVRRPGMVFFAAGQSVRRRQKPTAINAVKKVGVEKKPVAPESGVNEAVEIRNYFPETWLWDLETVGSEGFIQKKKTIPHTITEWVGSLFCTSNADGLGVSESASIKAFQPFFISYTLPYSVVRKEKVPVVVSIFNYLTDCIPMKISLDTSDDYIILSDRTLKVCACGSQPVTHKFKILPKSLGTVNLTVQGHSLKDEDHKVCGTDQKSSSIEARDAITKPLLVEPEGFPQESTKSVLFCPSENENGVFKHEFMLELPDDVVEGSARAFYSVSGDLMGPSLSGLDKLVALPVGCGEQNMILFAPNIFVLQYLKGTDSASAEIENKAREYMKIGYQRELNYRHKDGSYSAFGESDREGSLWLTSFVVKSFAQARQFIDIDPDDLKKSVEWLVSKQDSNGCFPFIGMLHHQDMKGGIGKDKLTALTAYTVISLLESESAIKKEAVDNAFQCMKRDTDPNSYTLALTAYAAVLNDDRKLTGEILEKLYKNAVVEGVSTYWPAGSKSVSVELGAYVILTLSILGGTENTAKALSIVRWIAQQRNSKGGFVSTQDTVIALQAFARFSVQQSKDKQNLQIKAEGNNFAESNTINHANRLLMQTSKITELPNIIDVEATGDGCGLAQIALKYNKGQVKATEAWELSATGIVNRWNCKTREINICARYKIPKEKSNMAVIAVKMVSGYVPNKDSLKSLKFDSKLNLKRYEVDANFVNFYFESLDNEEKCFKFKVNRDVEVEDTKPATVTVYDYYISELRLDKSYILPEECKRPGIHIEPVPVLRPGVILEDAKANDTTEAVQNTTSSAV